MNTTSARTLLLAIAVSGALPWKSLTLHEQPSSTRPAVSEASDDVARFAKDLARLGGSGACVLANCTVPTLQCLTESHCSRAVLCNAKCFGKATNEACNLLCELTYGYNSSKYRNVLQCMSDHECLPAAPSDGVCLANNTDTIKNLTDMAQVKGKWWIIRGLNCGQPSWPAGFDYFPCQRDEFVMENGTWIDHIAYCGGKNNTCETPMCHTVANVSLTSPGVMTHW